MERNNAMSYGRTVTAEKGKYRYLKHAEKARLECWIVNTPNIYEYLPYFPFKLIETAGEPLDISHLLSR